MSIYVLGPTHYLCIYTCVVIFCIHLHQRKGWIPMMNRWQQGSAGEGPRATFGAQGIGGPGDPQKVHYREYVGPAISGRSRLLKVVKYLLWLSCLFNSFNCS